jgi:hypothetical protein
MNVLDTWQITLQAGLNKFFVAEAKSYPKGTMVLLEIQSGGVFINDKARIADYVFTGSPISGFSLSNLPQARANYNSSFCLKVLITRYYYVYPKQSFTLLMNQSGQFDLTASTFDPNTTVTYFTTNYSVSGKLKFFHFEFSTLF